MQRFSHVDPLVEAGTEVQRVQPGAPRSTRRTLVVAHDPLVARSLASLLPGEEVEQVSCDDSRGRSLREAHDSVVMWDLGPQGQPGTALRQLPDFRSFASPVIVLCPPGTDGHAVLASGAAGAISRDATPDQLRSTTDAVDRGLHVVDPALLPSPPTRDFHPRDLPTRDSDAARGASLTARETQVLELLALGWSNKRIAANLGISSHTAKFHIAAILDKLDASTRTEAVVRGVQRGVVTL